MFACAGPAATGLATVFACGRSLACGDGPDVGKLILHMVFLSKVTGCVARCHSQFPIVSAQTNQFSGRHPGHVPGQIRKYLKM